MKSSQSVTAPAKLENVTGFRSCLKFFQKFFVTPFRVSNVLRKNFKQLLKIHICAAGKPSCPLSCFDRTCLHIRFMPVAIPASLSQTSRCLLPQCPLLPHTSAQHTMDKTLAHCAVNLKRTTPMTLTKFVRT